MARAEFLLQAVGNTNHATVVRELFRRVRVDTAIVSVGFAREAGVAAIEEAIRPIARVTTFFVGIRNDITSIQSIKRLLHLDTRIYVVDTGSRNPIFHPKLYMAAEQNVQAELIIGSANLTHQGLHNNIEASSRIALDLQEAEDNRFAQQVLATFLELPNRFPQHVFRVADDAHADMLYETGRLADELVVPAPSTTNTVRSGERDSLPRMELNSVAVPPLRRAARPRRSTTRPRQARDIAEVPTLPVPGYRRVWKSKALTERDLNIPRARGTHRTGSMLWKKGAVDEIDQRHYFREEIFDTIAWAQDPHRPHIERARANFEIVIKNLNYGKFVLQLSHNLDTASRTYQQNNAMTQIHWGEVLPIIAKRDLLGRAMFLYKKDTVPPEFLIEID